MLVHLYDFRWTTNLDSEFIASHDNTLGKRLIKLHEPLSLKITSGPSCAGSRRDGVWRPCSDQVTGRRQCERCRSREGDFVFTSFDGYNTQNFSAEELKKIAGEHWVYLSLFDRQILKVGVCKEDRKVLRQVEQGAHFSLFIARTPNGILARQIESVLRKAGLPDKIPVGRKKEFICPDIAPQKGEEILLAKYRQCQEWLNDHHDLRNFCLSKPEFYDWEEHYQLNNIRKSRRSMINLDLQIGESVSGLIVARKGPFLFLRTDEEDVVLCTKDLLGRWLDFTALPIGLQVNSAVQGSLF